MHQLIQGFAQHLVERYGLSEVATWYFEVWYVSRSALLLVLVPMRRQVLQRVTRAVGVTTYTTRNEPNLRNQLGPINLGEFWDGMCL